MLFFKSVAKKGIKGILYRPHFSLRGQPGWELQPHCGEHRSTWLPSISVAVTWQRPCSLVPPSVGLE